MIRAYSIMTALLCGVFCVSQASGDSDWVGDSPTRDDTQAEVLLKVGTPTWKLRWEKSIVRNRNEANETSRQLHIEEWYYNYGPRSLIRVVHFTNNRVAETRTHGYGYTQQELAGRAIDSDEKLSVDKDTQFEVLRKWGPPWHQFATQTERYSPRGDNTSVRTQIERDEWTYNFGPQRFMQILIFENGQLVEIRRGSYGK